jgi:hypothetical protein
MPPRAGPPTSGDLAKVHAAMHDAVDAIERRYRPYLPDDAATRILQRFFDTNRMDFQVTSNVPAVVNKMRSYKRFSEAAQQVVDARVLLGIHFRFADDAARQQGWRVGDYVFGNLLRPLDQD